MSNDVVFDEYAMRKLPPGERFKKIQHVLNRETDESVRWDCIWLAGEILNEDKSLINEIAQLMVWVLNNDDNSIVRHEAAFQIGLHNMRDKIPDLVHSIMNDRSDLVKHEAIEALGLLREHQSMETLETMLKDPSEAVRDTAWFVIRRLKRLRGQGEYRGEAII